MPFALLSSTAPTAPSINWGTVLDSLDFSPLLDGVISAIPIMLPIMIAAFGIRAGWRFIRKSAKSAAKI